MEDVISGCLMGCALGDSLGVPMEFYFHRNNVYTGILYIAPEFHFRCGTRTDVIGQISDDSEMTLANIRAVIKTNGKYNREQTIIKYMEWASTSKAIGINTRKLFKGVKTLNGYQKRYDALYKGTDKSTWSQSNGSLMRCSILSFFGEEAVIADCKLSNPTTVNIDSSRLYSFLIRSCTTNQTRDKIVKQVLKMDLCDKVMDTFKDAISSEIIERDVTVNKGHVIHALYCASYSWFYGTSFQDTIDIIIRLGGDTDTNACIAGALLGAKLGLEAMLHEERTYENAFTVLVSDSNLGDNPRPTWLTLDDFFEVTEKLAKLIEKIDK